MEVEVGVVPARDSVQGARYEALGVARLACGVPELSKSILEIVPGAYGGAKKALHFLPACASESMERVVEAARAELEVRRAERRSAGAEGAPASERRSTGGSGAWVAVVICAGWNCNEVENLQEAFVVKQLCETQTWSEFLWACSAHSSKKRAWAKTAQALDLAPPKLFQTNREDHPQAAANKAQFAQGLERHFVGDAECVEDVKSLGGSALLARYESFQQPAHRADLWRYIRLWKEGGSYLDIKMALLQPWSTTLQEIYAEGERCLEGQRVAQSSGQRVAPPTEVRDLSQVPHLLLSIGQNRKHIFQGNIWHASAKHPLLARAVGHALGTSQSHLKRYLLFCEFLWAELRRDLGKDPVQGWNFCPTLGPIYLFQEQMDGWGRNFPWMVTSCSPLVARGMPNSKPEQRFVRGLGHGASLLSCERGFQENFLRTCFVSPEESQRSTSPLARASLMPATHTPGDDSQVSGDSETFVPAYFVLPEQRLARGLGHRASQQHPPRGRRLTALASLSRSRKSGEPLQPKTLKIRFSFHIAKLKFSAAEGPETL